MLAVSATGGHLGSNLGVVELTLALHRVFDSPAGSVVWDTGHQAYVHKSRPGAAWSFAGLRQPAGCRATRTGPSPRTTWSRTATRRPASPTPTGWPGPTSCSADAPRGLRSSVTGADRWTRLRGVEQHRDLEDAGVVVVLNDNGRSYSPTVSRI